MKFHHQERKSTPLTQSTETIYDHSSKNQINTKIDEHQNQAREREESKGTKVQATVPLNRERAQMFDHFRIAFLQV